MHHPEKWGVREMRERDMHVYSSSTIIHVHVAPHIPHACILYLCAYMYIELWCQHDSVCQYVYLEVRSEVIWSHILHCTTEFVEVDHTPRDWIDLNPLLLSVVAILLLDRAGDERGFAREDRELHAWYKHEVSHEYCYSLHILFIT